MVSRVYVETEIRNHARTQRLLKRLRKLPVIEIEHFGEVFNPRAQNFRLQKKDPAIIIAAKKQGHVLAAPEGYGLGGDRPFGPHGLQRDLLGLLRASRQLAHPRRGGTARRRW